MRKLYMLRTCLVCINKVDKLPYSRKKKSSSKLGWHGNFDTGFERSISYFVQNPVCGFFEPFRNSDCLLVYSWDCWRTILSSKIQRRFESTWPVSDLVWYLHPRVCLTTISVKSVEKLNYQCWISCVYSVFIYSSLINKMLHAWIQK